MNWNEHWVKDWSLWFFTESLIVRLVSLSYLYSNIKHVIEASPSITSENKVKQTNNQEKDCIQNLITAKSLLHILWLQMMSLVQKKSKKNKN